MQPQLEIDGEVKYTQSVCLLCLHLVSDEATLAGVLAKFD